MFEVVEIAAFGREDVQDDVAVVLQNPRFGITAFDADTRAAAAFLHQLLNLFGDGTHLAPTGCSRDDEEIDDWRDLSQVEDQGVFALEVCTGLRGQTGKFATGLLTIGECGGGGFCTSGDGDVSESQQERFNKRKPANLVCEAKSPQNVVRRRCSRLRRRAAR